MKRHRIVMAVALVAAFVWVSSVEGNGHGQIVVTQQPALLQVPAYGAQYTGGAGNDELIAVLQQILAKLDSIERRLAQGGPPGQELRQVDAVAVMKRHCAACHKAGDPKGDFEMFDATGQILKLNGPDRKAIGKRVADGTMPPKSKGTLTQDEKAAVDAFATAKAIPPAKK